MKHYKTTSGQIYAFEEDGSQDHLITGTMIPLSGKDLDDARNPPLSTKESEALKDAEDKHVALSYLRDTDWYVIRELETGKKIPAKVKGLRDAARVTAKVDSMGRT